MPICFYALVALGSCGFTAFVLFRSCTFVLLYFNALVILRSFAFTLLCFYALVLLPFCVFTLCCLYALVLFFSYPKLLPYAFTLICLFAFELLLTFAFALLCFYALTPIQKCERASVWTLPRCERITTDFCDKSFSNSCYQKLKVQLHSNKIL